MKTLIAIFCLFLTANSLNINIPEEINTSILLPEETARSLSQEDALPEFSITYNVRYETSRETKIIVWSWKGGSTVKAEQLRQTIEAVHERLSFVPKDCDGYVELLMETCAAESLRGIYVKQKRGSAKGIFQMEPSTEEDTRKWLKKRHPEVYKEVMAFWDEKESQEWNLAYNVPYTAAMSTAYYWRRCGDALAYIVGTQQNRALIWKKYYNTHLGKGTIDGYLKKAKKYL